MPDNIRETALRKVTGGTSQAVSISTTSAQSAAITTSNTAVIYATADCFMRMGSDPTALSDGTDQFIPANLMLRVYGLESGDKLAFKTATGTGTVYITPGV